MNRLSLSLLLLLLLLLTTSAGLNTFLLLNISSDELQKVITIATSNRQPAPGARHDERVQRQSNSANQDGTTVSSAQDNPLTTTDTDNEQTLALAAKANQLFEQQWFEQAIEVYEQLLGVDEVAAIVVKRNWLEQLRQQLKEQDFLRLGQFNQAIMARFPYDLEFLTLYADTLAATDNPLDAINQYHSLISYSFEQEQQQFYQARIDHIGAEQLKRLEQQLAWQAMIDFSDIMLQQQPGYPPYILAHGKALIETGQLALAQRVIEPVLEISFYRQQAQTLLTAIDKLQLHQTAIKLQPMGEHYLVNGLINRTNPINLMLDTGASISLLTQTMFDEIASWTNPEYIRDTQLNTAGGQINASIYRFERFAVDDFYVDNIDFVVVDLDNMAGYHGLLGMNFLKHFKFHIEQDENLLILSPK